MTASLKPLAPGEKGLGGQSLGSGGESGLWLGALMAGRETWLAHGDGVEEGEAQHPRELFWTNSETRHGLE